MDTCGSRWHGMSRPYIRTYKRFNYQSFWKIIRFINKWYFNQPSDRQVPKNKSETLEKPDGKNVVNSRSLWKGLVKFSYFLIVVKYRFLFMFYIWTVNTIISIVNYPLFQRKWESQMLRAKSNRVHNTRKFLMVVEFLKRFFT